MTGSLESRNLPHHPLREASPSDILWRPASSRSRGPFRPSLSSRESVADFAPVEQRLQERGWFAVTETLLALTIFREEFDTYFILFFVSLLFLKVFHWLIADRIEIVRLHIAWYDYMLTAMRDRWSNRLTSRDYFTRELPDCSSFSGRRMCASSPLLHNRYSSKVLLS